MTAAVRGPDLDDRGDDRSDRAEPRRWPILLAMSLVLLLVVGGAAVVWISPVLGLRTVQVQGSGAAALTDQVRAAVGVRDGTPLIRIDLSQVRDRVAGVGPVASAEVQRQWPDTLIVTVTERVPLAVTQANGQWWLLDATGKPYQQVPQPPPNLTPIDLATPGEGDRATLAALGVLGAVGALPPSIREQVTKIVAPTEYDISLVLTEGRTVVWGATDRSATKVAVLPALLAQAGTVYDVTDPTLATVR